MVAAWTLVLGLACKGGDAEPAPESPTETGDSTPAFTVEPAECDAVVLDADADPPEGDCVTTDDLGPLTMANVRVDCTDPAITALGSKRHLVVVPEDVQTQTLWVHLGGTGGKPQNSTWLARAAAEEGYRFIGLAYPNEPSVAERCVCPEGPREADCEERVRTELLYGVDAAPYFEMEPDEAIVYRLQALLSYLADENPSGGWSNYLDESGEVRWSRLAVSGFSQGGGMAGMIARDHAVDRAMYLSKGGGSSLAALVDPDSIQECSDAAECASGHCCAIEDMFCTEAPATGGFCIETLPSPWTGLGPDVDGDWLGDGPPSGRATPAERQFALIHRDEGAWDYSPDVFEGWGMGDRNDYTDLDSQDPPYAGQLWSTGATPSNGCSEHQSMGADACMAKDADGVPLAYPVWRWIMALEI